ncbi:MAG TPA: proprotein convertase P-domain-containing protein, partial [Phycisphaerae bacterium]|nr:proprotein convertase P-domain-containing protein [Phycisphaerae bacterium]
MPQATSSSVVPIVPVTLEPLEPRLLLSVDLPGMRLVDPSVDRFDGQIVYLDFDGEQNVPYNGPVTVEDIDVPAFSAPGGLVGQEQAILPSVLDRLGTAFADTGVTFTTSRPDLGLDHSTVFIGGDDSAFAEYGSFLGLAEQVDVGNLDALDNAFVFSSYLAEPGVAIDEYADNLIHLISHETGHLLGYAHNREPEVSSPLYAVSETGTIYENPWYGQKDIGDGQGLDGRAIWEVNTSGAPGDAIITDVDVWYEIDHTYVGDLVVWLTTEQPSGTWYNQNLWDREGGSENDIEEKETGLDKWDGLSPNRTWYLCAADYATPDKGHIEEWKIWVHWATQEFEVTDAEVANLDDLDGDGFASEFDFKWKSKTNFGSATVTAEIWADSYEVGIYDRKVA